MHNAAAALIVIAAVFDGLGAVHHLFSGGSSAPTDQVEVPARPEDVLKYRKDSLPGGSTSGLFGFALLILTGAAVGCAVLLFQKQAPVFAAATGAAQVIVGLLCLIFGSGFEYRDMIGIPAGIVVVAAAATYWPDPNAEDDKKSHQKSGKK